MTAFWVTVGIVALVLIYVLFTYYGLVASRHRTLEAWAEIDIELKRHGELTAEANREHLAAINEKMAFSRHFYNGNVKDFNTAIRRFPASLMGFKPFEPYQDDAESQSASNRS